MPDLTPAARHARLVAEIKRRERSCVSSLIVSGGLAHKFHEEHAQELEALLEIVERHAPILFGVTWFCGKCRGLWTPCADFLSAEKVLEVKRADAE